MILVTGASGFVGRQLIASLLAAGENVRGSVRSAASAALLRGLGVECCAVDLGSGGDLEAMVAGARAVVHLAAVMEAKDATLFHTVNVEGTSRLLAACERVSVSRFLLVSSLDATLDINAYGRSKNAAEELVRRSRLPWTILRPAPIYGRDDQVITPLQKLVARLPVLPVLGSGRQRLQLVHVGDVVQAIERALRTDRAIHKTYSLAGPVAISLEQLMRDVARGLGVRRVHVRVPAAALMVGAALLERLLRHPPLTRDRVRGLLADRLADAGDARADLDWQPRWLAELLPELLRPPAPDARGGSESTAGRRRTAGS